MLIICLNTVKWFQVLLFYISNSSSICTQFNTNCHVIAHGDEEVRLILSSHVELALSSSQKVTVKRECGSQRG